RPGPAEAAVGAAAPGVGIELHGVSYAYELGRRVLDGIDLTIRPGRTVARSGATGAGKTTLLEIIAGLLAPTDGTVAVEPGGRSLVFQEPFLFAGAIRETVGLGA